MEYTKEGEWEASPTHNFTGTLVSYITCGEKEIAQTRLSDNLGTEEENDANARLISAAPELYEALTELMAACSRHDQTGINIAYNIGKVALAKAES